MELGRWISEVKEVWKVCFVDVGLVLLLCAVGFMVPGLLVQRVGSPIAVAAFWAVVLPVMAWLMGAVHLQCFRNAEAGTSTSFSEASQEAFERWDDVVLGVVFCGLMLGVAGALVLPGVVACGVLLPYVVIVMAEKKGPIDALHRNIQLAQGRWVALVVYWMLYYAAVVIGLCVMGVLTVVVTTAGLVSVTGMGTVMAMVAVVGGVSAFFLAPLPVIAAVATYRLLAEDSPVGVSTQPQEPEVGASPQPSPAYARTSPSSPEVAPKTADSPLPDAHQGVVVATGASVMASTSDEGIEVDLDGFDEDAPIELEPSGLAGDSVFDDEPEGGKEEGPGFAKAPRADEGPYW